MDIDYQPTALTRTLGGVAIAGCLAAAFFDLLGAGLSEQINPIRDTISNLAANNRNNVIDELADAGLYAFALAVLATSAGLLRWRIDRWDWKIGTISLVILAGAVTLIAGYEAYTTGDGPKIHYRLVYVLGAAFPLSVALTAGQFRAMHNSLGIALYAGAAIWALAAPLLFVVPTAFDGLYERALAAAMLSWFALMGLMIWRNPDIVRELPKEARE